MVKVQFKLVGDYPPEAPAVERLWAEDLGEGRYRLHNTPFFARGYSFLDVVAASAPDRIDVGLQDEVPIVTHAIIRSGHSTYRVRAKVPTEVDPAFDEYWAQLEAIGCVYEGFSLSFLAIDVPPETDVYSVYRILKAGSRDGVWDFEEGHCGHPLKG